MVTLPMGVKTSTMKVFFLLLSSKNECLLIHELVQEAQKRDVSPFNTTKSSSISPEKRFFVLKVLNGVRMDIRMKQSLTD